MKPSTKPTLFLALACLSLVGGGGAVYWQYSQLNEADGQVERLQTKLSEARVIEAQLAESATKLLESSTKLAHLEKGVPQLEYIPTLLTELEAVGKQHAIKVLGVRPMAPKTADSKDKLGSPRSRRVYEELDIEVKGRGRYAAVLEFLEALQRFPKIIAVRTATLTPKRELNDTGAPNLDVTVEIRAFLFPPTEAELKLADSLTTPAPAPSTGQPLAPQKQPGGGAKPNGIG